MGLTLPYSRFHGWLTHGPVVRVNSAVLSGRRCRPTLPSAKVGEVQGQLPCCEAFRTSSPMMPRQGVQPALHSPQTSTWPQVAPQTRDVYLAFGDNRPLLLQGHRPRHGLQWSSGQDLIMVLGGIIISFSTGSSSLPLSLQVLSLP